MLGRVTKVMARDKQNPNGPRKPMWQAQETILTDRGAVVAQSWLNTEQDATNWKPQFPPQTKVIITESKSKETEFSGTRVYSDCKIEELV